MTRRILGLAVAALAVSASVASAHTTVIEPEGSHFPYQGWVDEAAVPTPNLQVTVIEEPCPTLPRVEACTALTSPGGVTTWISPATFTRGLGWPPLFFYHELGHNFDFAVMSHWSRKRFRLLRHSRRPWQTPQERRPRGLEEVFADSYAGCAYNRPNLSEGGWQTFAPRVCALIENAARLRGVQ